MDRGGHNFADDYKPGHLNSDYHLPLTDADYRPKSGAGQMKIPHFARFWTHLTQPAAFAA
jgi:hypothetical protein